MRWNASIAEGKIVESLKTGRGTVGSIYETFEGEAVPHSWFLVARELNEQAEACFNRKGQSLLHRRASAAREEVVTFDLANRAAFLLGGFALENIIKAFLVYENPQWIANGKLSRKLTSGGHKLVELGRASKRLPWPKRGQLVLREFEDGLTSWARYPCPTTSDELRPQKYFSDRLWMQYRAQFSRYSAEMRSLLGQTWRGPHVFEGRYTIEGNF